jgi:hypothetical protein
MSLIAPFAEQDTGTPVRDEAIGMMTLKRKWNCPDLRQVCIASGPGRKTVISHGTEKNFTDCGLITGFR